MTMIGKNGKNSLNNTIILLQKESDFSKFENEIKKYPSAKIFSLDYESHLYLEKNNFTHELAENLLLKFDFENVDNFTKKFIQNWIPEKLKTDFSINNIFLPSLIEHELFFYLLPIFLISVMIEKIIEHEKPKQIIDLTQFSKFTTTLVGDKEIIKISPTQNKLFYHDNVSINLSLMKIPVNFQISKNTFVNIKKISTSFTDKILNSNMKNNSKKNILLVNFDPIKYKIFFNELKHQNINPILYNPRKPAITNLKSFNIVKNSNSKIFNHLDISKEDIKKIEIEQDKIKNLLTNHFENIEYFTNLFDSLSFEFWNSIKPSLKQICIQKFNESIQNIFVLTNFFNTYNISLILQWAEVGQEEKECMYVGKNHKIKSFMLQHGRFLTSKKWTDISNFTGHFPKKIISDGQFIWGKFTKDFGLSQGYENKQLLISGSPSHDEFFNSKKNSHNSKKILLATTGAMYLSADTCTIKSQLKHDAFIKEVCNIVSNIPDKELVVRSHPSPILTEHVRSLLENIDSKIQLVNNSDLIKLIQDSELVITFNNSTVCLDAISLNKPVISLQTDDWSLDEEIVLNNGVLSISNSSDCEMYINKILTDYDFRKDLLNNSKLFLENYIHNSGTASKHLAKTISNLI